ncbi:MAG: putative ABC transporter permease [Clostridia bacterium]|nr:putative ABC transporter permease [Clostridia bacterium]
MMDKYCIYFVVYSFLGWIYESLFYSAQLRKPVNTGFLHGCFCPIYGLACVANVALLNGIENNALLFIMSMLIISVIEFTVSYVLETLFDKRWWDYSNWPCNINGRISLISSLGFGIMSVIQLRMIHPFIEAGTEALSNSARSVFLGVTLICISIDLLYTVIRMNKEEERYEFLDEGAEFAKRAFDRMEEGRIHNLKEYIRERFSK